MSSIAADAVIASADTEIAADCSTEQWLHSVWIWENSAPKSCSTACTVLPATNRIAAQSTHRACNENRFGDIGSETGRANWASQHNRPAGASTTIINCQFTPSLVRPIRPRASGVEDLTEHPVKNFKLLKPTHADARESAVALVSTAYPHVASGHRRLERVSVSANVRVHKAGL